MNEKIIYFGYGSNMWLDQMRRRCPENRFLGVGVLPGWKWIINVRGYANIIPSKEDIVYGFIFELTRADERRLDKFEGQQYERMNIPVNRIQPKFKLVTGEAVTALVYIDVERKEVDEPKDEYIYRMNMAIQDGLKEGIHKEYFDQYLRPFIPEQ